MVRFEKLVGWLDVVGKCMSFDMPVDFALYVDLLAGHSIMKCWFLAFLTYVQVNIIQWVWMKTFGTYSHVVLWIFRVRLQ